MRLGLKRKRLIGRKKEKGSESRDFSEELHVGEENKQMKHFTFLFFFKRDFIVESKKEVGFLFVCFSFMSLVRTLPITSTLSSFSPFFSPQTQLARSTLSLHFYPSLSLPSSFFSSRPFRSSPSNGKINLVFLFFFLLQ